MAECPTGNCCKHAIEEEMHLCKVHGCASEKETVIERVKIIINPSTTPHGMASDVLDILPLVKPTGRVKVNSATKLKRIVKHQKAGKVANKTSQSYPFYVDIHDEHGKPIQIFHNSVRIEYMLPHPGKYPLLYVNKALAILKSY